jgi:multiple sugar transport system substrate-binding protein
MENPIMADMPDIKEVIELSKSPNLKSTPNFEKRSEFGKVIGEETELLFNLKQTPDETIKAIMKKTEGMVK